MHLFANTLSIQLNKVIVGCIDLVLGFNLGDWNSCPVSNQVILTFSFDLVNIVLSYSIFKKCSESSVII